MSEKPLDELTILRTAIERIAAGSATETPFIEIGRQARRDAAAARKAAKEELQASAATAVPSRWDDDGYWLECVRKSKSNSAVAGFLDFVAFIESGAADDRALSGIAAALRSLSQRCRDELSERKEAQRLARYNQTGDTE
jgi:hypothetical protein